MTTDLLSAERGTESLLLAVRAARQRSRRWYIDRQAPPPSLHCSVNAVHEAVLDEFLVDLDAAIDSVRGDASPGAARAYGTVG